MFLASLYRYCSPTAVRDLRPNFEEIGVIFGPTGFQTPNEEIIEIQKIRRFLDRRKKNRVLRHAFSFIGVIFAECVAGSYDEVVVTHASVEIVRQESIRRCHQFHPWVIGVDELFLQWLGFFHGDVNFWIVILVFQLSSFCVQDDDPGDIKEIVEKFQMTIPTALVNVVHECLDIGGGLSADSGSPLKPLEDSLEQSRVICKHCHLRGLHNAFPFFEKSF